MWSRYGKSKSKKKRNRVVKNDLVNGELDTSTDIEVNGLLNGTLNGELDSSKDIEQESELSDGTLNIELNSSKDIEQESEVSDGTLNSELDSLKDIEQEHELPNGSAIEELDNSKDVDEDVSDTATTITTTTATDTSEFPEFCPLTGKKLVWKEVRVKMKRVSIDLSSSSRENNEHDESNDNDSEQPRKYIKREVVKEEFEVEAILDKAVSNNTTYYLIKWKGWAEDFNSWEPKRNLKCKNLLDVFEFEDHRFQMVQTFRKLVNFNKPSRGQMVRYMLELKRHNSSIDDPINWDPFYEKLAKFNQSPTSAWSAEVLRDLKDEVFHALTKQERVKQLKTLSDWEDEMNDIAKNQPNIKVENEVDLEGPPANFTYINVYQATEGVIIPEDPIIGCGCDNCDWKKRDCCYAQYGALFPYTATGRIRVKPGTPIYECNKRCSCSDDCRNRVVQKGSNAKLCIFRTDNGRGWGVKTLRGITKGTFVIQYVGEVITNEVAGVRSKKHEQTGRTYLFDLDYNEPDGSPCKYTVDAEERGNVSHFINHSCEPNLAVYAVWINCMDPDMPQLALFATRDIKQNEEITFDYNSQGQKLDQGNIRCKCGAAGCKRYLF
ncbi:hypothetical protein TKK_0014313 [Trichogramma kaykai]|uniref:[Histone H3]-lysine(9) N-trimethyltransferase n=1 Tax=Trichogramma kaykai TaxID=54128 RepID=A0ABD2WE47_9HYME